MGDKQSINIATVLLLASPVGFGAVACKAANTSRPPSATRVSVNPVDNALALAGYVLAHAAWSVSDLPEGEHLIPLAVLEIGGKRRLVRYVEDTTEKAIARGNAEMGRASKSFDLWAFAWEGLGRQNEKEAHVLNVEFWARGMGSPGRLVQKFEPFVSGRFRVLGDPTVVINGRTLKGSEASAALARVAEGIQKHPKVSRLWQTWKSGSRGSPRTPAPRRP